MATFTELRERLQPADQSTIVLRLVDFDDFKMVCLECDMASAVVSEYDQAGLEDICAWGQAHVCVIGHG